MINSNNLARLWIIVALAFGLGRNFAIAEQEENCESDSIDCNARALLWSSTGGGWRAMFADIGYANMFRQAGLFDETSTRFNAVATVSGGSWFSTQLFYSHEFYNQVILAQTPEELEEFALKWMGTYVEMSVTSSEESRGVCRIDEIDEIDNISSDQNDSKIDGLKYVCQLLVENDASWAVFIQRLLEGASTNYGDPGFVDTIASPENRIEAMQNTDLLIQIALAPNSLVRESNKVAYLGYRDDTGANADPQLFTTILSAAWVVTNESADFWYNTDDVTDKLEVFTAPTAVKYSWNDWDPFFLYPGTGGTITINASDVITTNIDDIKEERTLRTPFGGAETTTVLQVAAASSAAEGGSSPAAPSIYSQHFSIGRHSMEENKVQWWKRVLAGIASGFLGAVVFGSAVYCVNEWRRRGYSPTDVGEDGMENKTFCVILASGSTVGLIVGLLVGFFYGLGTTAIPAMFNIVIGSLYQRGTFDDAAVCSQWPNKCGEQDAILIDGYYVDNPAVVINVGNYLQKNGVNTNETLKIIVTNTNDVWDDEWNFGQILQYFSTTFNEGVDPGGFVWVPGQYAPTRSPQIFEEYLDKDGLNAALESIPNSEMTTARLKATTIDNPSFGTLAGQPMDILLLNLNENIPTSIIQKGTPMKYTQPLADMTKHVAFNEELLKRVKDFVGVAS